MKYAQLLIAERKKKKKKSREMRVTCLCVFSRIL